MQIYQHDLVGALCCCCCELLLYIFIYRAVLPLYHPFQLQTRSGAMNVALLTVSVTLLSAGFATVRLAEGNRHSSSGNTPMVLSPEDSYIRAVSGFGTELECYANTCVSKNRTNHAAHMYYKQLLSFSQIIDVG
ncbi:conserved hypothetical protein [Trichinella spiralis]|uniref:hypothetical protein n=1 Tax=Trichinella spiralis TaxID=6334 RepID=UPI0001EFBD17|nr:conserved hypothetical protein [Trichinella spiralis]